MNIYFHGILCVVHIAMRTHLNLLVLMKDMPKRVRCWRSTFHKEKLKKMIGAKDVGGIQGLSKMRPVIM